MNKQLPALPIATSNTCRSGLVMKVARRSTMPFNGNQLSFEFLIVFEQSLFSCKMLQVYYIMIYYVCICHLFFESPQSSRTNVVDDLELSWTSQCDFLSESLCWRFVFVSNLEVAEQSAISRILYTAPLCETCWCLSGFAPSSEGRHIWGHLTILWGWNWIQGCNMLQHKPTLDVEQQHNCQYVKLPTQSFSDWFSCGFSHLGHSDSLNVWRLKYLWGFSANRSNVNNLFLKARCAVMFLLSALSIVKRSYKHHASGFSNWMYKPPFVDLQSHG